jgi:hypothetical protein
MEYFTTSVQHVLPYTPNKLGDCMQALSTLFKRAAQNGYLLLDLKPANVVLNQQHHLQKCTKIRVIDFGAEFVYKLPSHRLSVVTTLAVEILMSYMFMFALGRAQGYTGQYWVLHANTHAIIHTPGVRARMHVLLYSLDAKLVGERLDGKPNRWSVMSMIQHYSGREFTAGEIESIIMSTSYPVRPELLGKKLRYRARLGLSAQAVYKK